MKFIKNEKGSISVELAMFIAVICGLTFGYICLMNGVKTKMALQVAAREGSREYATTGDFGKGKNKAKLELSSMGVKDATIKTLIEGNGGSVTVTKDYKYSIPLFGSYNKQLKGYCSFYTEPVADDN